MAQARSSAGYSLLELLVVLAIMALIVTVGVPAIMGSFERMTLTADARAVATALRGWRDAALDEQKEITIAPAGLPVSAGTEAAMGAKSIVFSADGPAGADIRLTRGGSSVRVRMNRLTGRVTIEVDK